jgi:hypothetical protein
MCLLKIIIRMKAGSERQASAVITVPVRDSILRAEAVLAAHSPIMGDDEESAPDYVLRPESTHPCAGCCSIESDEMRLIIGNTNSSRCMGRSCFRCAFKKNILDTNFVPPLLERCVADGGVIRSSTEWTMDFLVDILSEMWRYLKRIPL